ncbi:tetratricopeptide repeat protein [Paeniroseomonas aquatica]|uniref:tetratricopeptide repeat protein n=1 Tax=Paeniroseomonas aquatica TaxID=373043 RepID=UPI00360A7881
MDMISWVESPDATADADALLARADALRDQQAWSEAADAYAAFLRLRPDHWAIRVQYGHCLKESGDPDRALLAYREAERLQPGDADIHLQIGHVLKRLDRHEEALEEYARALLLDPASPAARAEIMALDPGLPEPPAMPGPGHLPRDLAPPAAAAGQPAGAATVIFDASDLLDYFQHNRAPTGIQRVQLAIIREALAATPGVAIAGFVAGEGCGRRCPRRSSAAWPACRGRAPRSPTRPGAPRWPRCRRRCGTPRPWASRPAAAWSTSGPPGGSRTICGWCGRRRSSTGCATSPSSTTASPCWCPSIAPRPWSMNSPAGSPRSACMPMRC